MSPWPPVTVEDWNTWGWVISELNGHRHHPSHTWCDTINRLLRKGEFLTNAAGARIPRAEIPTIKPEILHVRSEHWPLTRLVSARNAQPHTRDTPVCDKCPILILHTIGQHFI